MIYDMVNPKMLISGKNDNIILRNNKKNPIIIIQNTIIAIKNTNLNQFSAFKNPSNIYLKIIYFNHLVNFS